MHKERRQAGNQVPDNIKEILNEQQLLTLRKVESYGWYIQFIRRPSFQTPVAVLFHPDNDNLVTLEEDGTLDPQTGIKVRE